MLVKIIKKGCPICGGEVRGNFKYLYFCVNCNILFKSRHLPISAEITGLITDNGKVLDRKAFAKEFSENSR